MIAEALEALRTRWEQLAARERALIALCAAVVLCSAAYVGVIKPLGEARRAAEARLATQRLIAADLERAAVQLPGGARSKRAGNQSLISIVDRSIRSSAIGKPASRLQPAGDTRARIWLEDVPFDALIRWIGELDSQYGVQVENADIDRSTGAGLVDARLTLVRN